MKPTHCDACPRYVCVARVRMTRLVMSLMLSDVFSWFRERLAVIWKNNIHPSNALG